MSGQFLQDVNYAKENFCLFLNTMTNIAQNLTLKGVLGIRTLGRSMVGADESTELLRPSATYLLFK